MTKLSEHRPCQLAFVTIPSPLPKQRRTPDWEVIRLIPRFLIPRRCRTTAEEPSRQSCNLMKTNWFSQIWQNERIPHLTAAFWPFFGHFVRAGLPERLQSPQKNFHEPQNSVKSTRFQPAMAVVFNHQAQIWQRRWKKHAGG